MEARGEILSGTKIAKEIKEDLINTVKLMSNKFPGFQPGLTIVQVGSREDSDVYIRTKIKTASEIGINAKHVKLPNTITQVELLSKLKRINEDPLVHGIIVQMPLDCVNNIDSHLVTDSVIPEKDVDGLNTINEGRVAIGDMSGFMPCTPNGCMELIKRSGIQIAGSNAVVLGRSKIVGTPAAELLKWHHATVTVCHSKTKNIEEHVRAADIVVVGIGQPEFVKGSWIKEGAVVIDCGINPVPDPTKKTGRRLLGDVAYEEAKLRASYITPVPGGVGPMTVAMLMKNTVIAAQRFIDKMESTMWSLSPLKLEPKDPTPVDIDISRNQEPKEVDLLAKEIGVYPQELSPYGRTKGKLSLSIISRLRSQSSGKYIVVTGINPTSLGEGKTTCTLGLAQALCAHKKRNTFACLRQPSQGPMFGIKGGAAGGGYSLVIPMEDFNLHLTGDIHAVTAANNLLAAQIDTRIFHELTQKDKALFERLVPEVKGNRQFSDCQLRRLKRLGIEKTDPNSMTQEEKASFARLDIDPDTVMWKRVVDISDRFLRKVKVGLSPSEQGHSRETGFTLSVASELMAILALAKDLEDMKERISKIVVATSKKGAPITADDLGATGALCILLKDAIEPTLMQTYEGTPVLVHTGPFANIAHGCSSIIADSIALKLVGKDGFVVTEAGFGTDIGLEKFMNIKCRVSGLYPDAIVLVVTVRALKMHGGGPDNTSAKEYAQENIPLLTAGLPHLVKHIENCKRYGPVVVCINSFNTDTLAEYKLIQECSGKAGAEGAIISTHWAKGGLGAVDLADMVINICKDSKSSPNFLYPLKSSLKSKIETIAHNVYGAGKVEIPENVMKKLSSLENEGFGELAVCMAKTALSLSGNPALKGTPKDFTLSVADAYLSAGAGFVVVLVGEISLIPGLPTRPCIYDMDLDTKTGQIHGLF